MNLSMFDVIAASERRQGTPAGLRGLGTAGDDVLVGGVAGLGELSAEMLAKSITAQTGIPTTANQIINRAGSVTGYPEAAYGTSRDRVLTILGRGYATEEGTPTAALDLIRPLITALGGTEPLYRMIRASVDMGLQDVLAKAALDIGRSLLSGGGDIGARILALIGGSETLARLAGAASAIADAVTNALPVIGAMFRLQMAFAEQLASWLSPPRGVTVRADLYAMNSVNLWAYLCNQAGLDPYASTRGDGTAGIWSAKFNPLLGEVVVNNSRGPMLGYVRAVDVGNYGFPDWRARFTSESALAFIRNGAPTDPRVRFDGQSGAQVLGCPCATGGMIRPYRWHQGRPEFRAAMVAASYLTGNTACVTGYGRFQTVSTAPWERMDPRRYDDTDPWYDLGYQPADARTNWFSYWNGTTLFLLAPWTPPWGGARRGPCCCANDADDDSRRNAMTRWLRTGESPVAPGRVMQPIGYESQAYVPRKSPMPTVRFARGGPVTLPGTVYGIKPKPKGWSTAKKIAVGTAVVGVPTGGYFLGRALGWWK